MNQADLYYKKMTETPVSKLIIRLGIPTTISMLITSIYNLVDTYFIGTLGESQQAATGILFTLQAIIQAIAFMLGHGSGTYVSKCLANKNIDESSEYVSSAFFSGALLGGILTFFGLIFLNPFMHILGSTSSILPYAKDYGLWVLISCPFMVCSLILNNNLRYEGKAFYAMIGLTAGALLNILGDYLFIVQMDLGVFGAGMSTAISQIISFIILIIFYFKMAQSRISFRKISKNKIVYFGIISAGFPSLIRQGLTSVSNGILNNLTKPFGDAAIAAMAIVNRYTSFVLCVGLGIGQGFQPVSSFNYQAKKYLRVKKGLIFSLLFGACVVAILSTMGFIFSNQIVRIFQKSEEVIVIGARALKYASIGALFLPLSVSINMLYQSIRKSFVASFLSLLRSGLIVIPLLFVLTNSFGLTGLQLSQPLADICTGLISIFFIIYFIKTCPNEADNEKINFEPKNI